MRIVRKGEEEATAKAIQEGKMPAAEVSKTVQLGVEDIVLVIVMAVLIVGYARVNLLFRSF